MTHPITGPQTMSVVTDSVYRPPYGDLTLGDYVTSSYRQKRPYNLPLPYYMFRRSTPLQVPTGLVVLQSQEATGGISGTQAFDVGTWRFGDWGGVWLDSQFAYLRNRASAKLQSKLSDTSSALTALAESRQTLGMIEKRLVNLLDFKRNWEKRRFKTALRSVLKAQSFKNRSKERQRKRRITALMAKPTKYWGSKTLAQAWIETWFGWLPTIGDVQKGVEVLSRPLPMEYISARSALNHDLSIDGRHVGRSWVVCGALIYVSNPNLYLASQLGLTNPIYTAYEVISKSWLLSWFVNIEQFFKQWSVFHGVTVDSPWKSVGIRDSLSFSYLFDGVRIYGKGYAKSFERSLGLPEVTLQWKGLNRLSATRGATLASLLTLRLK
jgi:hypothetical protein